MGTQNIYNNIIRRLYIIYYTHRNIGTLYYYNDLRRKKNQLAFDI